MKNLIKVLTLSLFIFGCSHNFLKYEKAAELEQNAEFEKKVQIKEVSLEVPPLAAEVKLEAPPPKVAPLKKGGVKKASKKSTSTQVADLNVRQPAIEDSEGFNVSRRPLVDPFKVGEKVVHSVSYFGAQAGTLTFSVKPFVEVNGKKSYNFVTDIKSSSLFSSFYSVDDQVETYVDFEQLVPHVFKLKIKESGQLKEARSYFDQQGLKASYWEKKYTEKNGHEEKKLDWELLPFSQNAFSSVYYMRIFKWNVGQEYAFRVSDDGKNIIFKGKALEKTKLITNAGEFDAIKIKAEIVSRGALTQTGDMYIWISADEHKYILRIEAKIKIGTLVTEVEKITP
ncbi:MAG: DUF3108 domain-containing protein [Bdellovibrio sp.]|nr:DUF3108 domain-containing protein [Bdellovibrio sp.]